jgi:23S rRNA (adenine1618-N6)-methyltransferase
MPTKKKEHPTSKLELHPRNKHRNRYDFKVLVEHCPPLATYVKLNAYNDVSIDFFNPDAVKMLNKALLMSYYDIVYWDIPQHYLCPPIPGRADYLLYMGDLLGSLNKNNIPKGDKIKCLDIGVGANCIYPIIGRNEFAWSFIGAEIDPIAIESATKIIKLNPSLHGNVEIRLQKNPKLIFEGVISKNEFIDISICNPPFHASLAEAQAGTMRKLTHLTGKKTPKPVLNFGGKNNELWCEGGEKQFIVEMIRQSKEFATSCLWFSTLVAKQASLDSIYQALKTVGAVEVKTISMGQGNKISRVVAWTFHNKAQQKKWVDTRWS